ncbi:MAG: replicative DNA helicase [Chthoniobacteraceae bacterium]
MAEDSAQRNPGSEKSRGNKPRSDLKGKVTYPPDFHREFPQAPDAEKGVLSSILLAPKEVIGLAVESGVTKESFYIPAHGEIFETLLELWNANRPIDFITIAQYLRDRNRLDQIGGPAALNDLFVFLPTAANAGYYIEILLEKYTLREIIKVCNEYSARSYEEQDNTAGLLDEVETKIFQIAKDRFKDKTASLKDMVMKAIGDINKLYESRGKISGLSTGFKKLDQLTDGLHGAEMFVIAARPSMGKTAFAMNMAEHIAVELGKAVAVFSLEMSSQQLVQRFLCSIARVNLASIRNGFLSDRDFPALTAGAAKLASAKILIDDTSSLSILELRAKARRMKSQHDIAAIFIDYLQLLRSSSRRAQDNRQLEIAEISSGLKALAKELNIPIVVLAQLNRNPEGRTGEAKGRPRLSDLRESGTIEQDADVVGLLIREVYYADTDEAKAEAEGKATLIIAKQRNGPTDDVPLTFLKEFTRFEDRVDAPEPGN